MNKLDNIINEEINKFILREKWYNPFSWGKNNLDKQDINAQDDLSSLGDGEEENEVSQPQNFNDNEEEGTYIETSPYSDEVDEEPSIDLTDDYNPRVVSPVEEPSETREEVDDTQQNQQPNYNYNYNTVNASNYVDMNGDYPISNALYKLVQDKKLRNSSRIFNVMKDLEAIGW